VERLSQPNRRRVIWYSSWVIFGLTGWDPVVLRSSCFFGSNTVWSELPNESFRNCSSK
jgi:hypothetical protein